MHWLLVVCALAAPKSLKIAALDISVKGGVSKGQAEMFSEMLQAELRERGHRVVSRDDIEQLLGLEKMKDALGCESASCLAEIGGALGVDEILRGAVARIGDYLVFTLKRIDTRKNEVTKQSMRKLKGANANALVEICSPMIAELYDEVRAAAEPVTSEASPAKSKVAAVIPTAAIAQTPTPATVPPDKTPQRQPLGAGAKPFPSVGSCAPIDWPECHRLAQAMLTSTSFSVAEGAAMAYACGLSRSHNCCVETTATTESMRTVLSSLSVTIDGTEDACARAKLRLRTAAVRLGILRANGGASSKKDATLRADAITDYGAAIQECRESDARPLALFCMSEAIHDGGDTQAARGRLQQLLREYPLSAWIPHALWALATTSLGSKESSQLTKRAAEILVGVRPP